MRLYNAHRQISLRLKPPQRILDLVPEHERWRYSVTPDVVKFVEKQRLHRTRKLESILKAPERYFSDPGNVPLEQRQQIFLPDFVIKMIRSQKPPRYATFQVPLWFNKLDMKDFLMQAYGVDTIHIRSVVRLQKVYREQKPAGGKTGVRPGSLKRPMSLKRMVVQLKEAFSWPEQIKDLSAFEKDTFDAAMKESRTRGEAQQASRRGKPRRDEEAGQSVAEQAKAILQGKTTWKPSWQSIATDMRMTTNRPPPPPP